MDIFTTVGTNNGTPVAKYAETWKRQVAELQAAFGTAIEEVWMPDTQPTDVPVVFVSKEKVIEVLRHCKTAPGFAYGFLADITATDEESDPRFQVVYNLLSHGDFSRLRLKVRVAEGDAVPTAVDVWPAANWLEREVWDMYGVKFAGHPDLRRILMDIRWEGHPLRKDYPLRGYQVFTEPETIDPKLLD